MNIIGLNSYHGDSSACLLQDGLIVAAAEEERFRRVKHWAGFPAKAIEYCLKEGNINIGDVNHIAVNSNPRVNLLRKAKYALARRPEVSLLVSRLRIWRQRQSIEHELQRAYPGASFSGRVHRIEHHMAHLASAFLVSPFDEAIVVSIDGFGDFSSAAWGVGRGREIEVHGRVFFPHSLGIFYQALTQYLGFPSYGDEYKVMGLAPYGEPLYLEQLRQVVHLHDDGSFALNLKYFRHQKIQIDLITPAGVPTFVQLFSHELTRLLGPPRNPSGTLEQRHFDIARSVQAMYEESFFHLLRVLHRRHRIDNLAIAGGCAMNSVANGKVRRQTPFERIYIPAAAGDAGGAIGSALVVWNDVAAEVAPSSLGPSVRRSEGAIQHPILDQAYLGPSFDQAAISALIESRRTDLMGAGCSIELLSDDGSLCDRTAACLVDGQVVGWFQGRMEWGPRALGNRSILCDPRRPDMKEILNLKIKRRESFRPFAPSVMREHVADWFEEDDDVPFMMQVFQIRAEKRGLIPAVTHVDGSGRLQTVTKNTNPLYHSLISSFFARTDVPMLLNTSFNENEPVVCRPEEAMDCFMRTRMDVLVLGNFFVTRGAKQAPATSQAIRK